MSATNQPTWIKVGDLGDVSPIDYSGGYVFVDLTGVYAPEVEWIDAPDEENEDGIGAYPWTVYRFEVPRCTFVDGILSSNQYHPEIPEWFAEDLDSVARSADMTSAEMIEALTGEDVRARADVYLAIGTYHGLENLDSYPLTFASRAEIEARYPEDGPAGPQTIVDRIAATTIAEVLSRPDVLDYYRAHLDGNCDFVFVEETLSARLEDSGVKDRSLFDLAYMRASGIVYGWLTATYKVTPPVWFQRGDPNGALADLE